MVDKVIMRLLLFFKKKVVYSRGVKITKNNVYKKKIRGVWFSMEFFMCDVDVTNLLLYFGFIV